MDYLGRSAKTSRLQKKKKKKKWNSLGKYASRTINFIYNSKEAIEIVWTPP